MKIFNLLFSVMFLLITANSFGEHGHYGFEIAHKSPFSIFTIFLIVAFIVIIGFLLYKYLPIKVKNKAEELNETAHNVAAERHAKGEISKTEYIAINDKLAQLDDESIEIAKLRLAKGEIDMKEYEEIFNILVKKLRAI